MNIKDSLHWKRVHAALAGTREDCVPVSLWKHYHLRDRAPALLAQATMALYHQFDFDLIKLTPSGLYGVQDWGVGLQFGRDDDTAPVVIHSPIRTAADWLSLPVLDPYSGALQRELEMCQHISQLTEGRVPFMMTLFSPLTLAQKLAGDQVYDHLRQEPAKLHQGLAVIRDTVVAYARACLAIGVPGYFLATQQAQKGLLSLDEYREFGLAYDQDVVEVIREAPVRMLHVCGTDIMLEEAARLEVSSLSWAAGETNPTLAEARAFSDKALAGGLNLETLATGTVQETESMVRTVLADGIGPALILAPDCVVKGPSPDANLAAAVAAARNGRS